MGVRRIHKQEFKMKSTYTTKERGWLVQVECKWCSGLTKDNLIHKLYTTHNLWGRGTTPHLVVYYVILHGGYI
jgi:hypothetical protein